MQLDMTNVNKDNYDDDDQDHEDELPPINQSMRMKNAKQSESKQPHGGITSLSKSKYSSATSTAGSSSNGLNSHRSGYHDFSNSSKTRKAAGASNSTHHLPPKKATGSSKATKPSVDGSKYFLSIVVVVERDVLCLSCLRVAKSRVLVGSKSRRK